MVLNTGIFIGIGSNKGDRKKNCKTAVKSLSALENTSIIKESSLYETEAWGKEDQNSFINCALEMNTEKNLLDFFSALQQTEKKIGKEKEGVWGPRNIDIDLLFFGRTVMDKPDLTVPHPRLHLRRFVLEPLAEIAPDFIHPVRNQTLQTLLHNLTDSKKVLKI